MAEKQPIARAADRQRQSEQIFRDCDGRKHAAIFKVAFDAGVKCFADAKAGFHDPFAMNLRQIMVRQEKMNLVGEIAFELGGLIEHAPAVFGAGVVIVIAVDEFMKDNVPLRIVCQVGRYKAPN